MAEIVRQTTVARDGMHNAFTDLQYWQGNYWVGYRKGTSHASMDGEAVVAVSNDRQRFREVAHLKMPGDCRDPKLLPIDKNLMAAYFPSWPDGAHKRWTDEEGVVRRNLQQYISFTRNGYDWEPIKPILEPRNWLWRIRPHEGRYYGLIQNLTGDWSNGNKPHELNLAVSDDLLEWETIARIGEGLGLNESDIHFCPDGEAWIVSRTAKSDEKVGSYFAASTLPYDEWEVQPMYPIVHAPVFLHHEDSLYVAGRAPTRPENEVFRFCSRFALWCVERGKIEPVLHIPAVGDCSYPGMIKDPEGRICMSYYSQHAYKMGVIEPPADTEGDLKGSAADVYFLELDL